MARNARTFIYSREAADGERAALARSFGAEWRPANPLFQLDNVIMTPHAAYYSEDSIRPVNVVEQPERDSA